MCTRSWCLCPVCNLRRRREIGAMTYLGPESLRPKNIVVLTDEPIHSQWVSEGWLSFEVSSEARPSSYLIDWVISPDFEANDSFPPRTSARYVLSTVRLWNCWDNSRAREAERANINEPVVPCQGGEKIHQISKKPPALSRRCTG